MDDKKDETLAIVPQQETASAHVPIAIGRISSKCFTFDVKTKINSATIYVNATKETILASLLDEASFRSVFHPYNATLANVQGDEIEYKVQGYTRRSFYSELNSFKFTVKEYEVQIQVVLPEKTQYISFVEDYSYAPYFAMLFILVGTIVAFFVLFEEFAFLVIPIVFLPICLGGYTIPYIFFAKCYIPRYRRGKESYLLKVLETYFDSFASEFRTNNLEIIGKENEKAQISSLVIKTGFSLLFSAISCLTWTTKYAIPIDTFFCLLLFLYTSWAAFGLNQPKYSFECIRIPKVIYVLGVIACFSQTVLTFARAVISCVSCELLNSNDADFGLILGGDLVATYFGVVNIYLLLVIASQTAPKQRIQWIFTHPVLFDKADPTAHIPARCISTRIIPICLVTLCFAYIVARGYINVFGIDGLCNDNEPSSSFYD